MSSYGEVMMIIICTGILCGALGVVFGVIIGGIMSNASKMQACDDCRKAQGYDYVIPPRSHKYDKRV